MVTWIGKMRNQDGYIEYVYLVDDGQELGYWERELRPWGMPMMDSVSGRK